MTESNRRRVLFIIGLTLCCLFSVVSCVQVDPSYQQQQQQQQQQEYYQQQQYFEQQQQQQQQQQYYQQSQYQQYSFEETTYESWGDRITASLFGVVFGFLLFIASFFLLWWNEGRAVRTAQALREGRKQVTSVDSAELLKQNEGKLVHLTGQVIANDSVVDPVFNVRPKPAVIHLRRIVEMYQWHERKKTVSRNTQVGGGKKTTTRYTYVQDWSDEVQDSSHFKDPNFQNPSSKPWESQMFSANSVKIGAFELSEELVGRLKQFRGFNLPAKHYDELPVEVRHRVCVENGHLYDGPISHHVVQPSNGNIRIRYEVVDANALVSVVAKQHNGRLCNFMTSVGNSIALIHNGAKTHGEMFAQAEQSSALMTWILRFVGWLMMVFGLQLIVEPMAVLLDVLPILGDILRLGTSLAAMLVAGAFSLFTVAVAWLRFRPFVSLLLICIATGIILLNSQ